MDAQAWLSQMPPPKVRGTVEVVLPWEHFPGMTRETWRALPRFERRRRLVAAGLLPEAQCQK